MLRGPENIAQPPLICGRQGLAVFASEHRRQSYERMDEAIGSEKQIKGGSRARKIALIQAMNPEWSDLYETLA